MSLGTVNMDYGSFYSLLKGNYRKGVHRFRTMLANPELAEDFSRNLGSVSVILGWPIGYDDKNSQELLGLLLASEVLTQATLTWLGQWYPENNEDSDTMYGDATRCQELVDNALMWRAVGSDPAGCGKLVVTLSGGNCADFADIHAVVADSEAMAAIAAVPAAMQALIASPIAFPTAAASATAVEKILGNSDALGAVVASEDAMEAMISSPMALSAMVASETVMEAIVGSPTALSLTVTSATAMKAVVGSSVAMGVIAVSQSAMTAVAASQTAMAAIIANSSALNTVVSSQTAMTAVAKSPVAMAAVWKSNTAVQKVQANATAWATFTGASSAVMGKAAAILAGLNPDSYADMTAVAASQTAMAAVADSSTAMQAIANSQTALNAIAASTTALDALYAKKKRMSGASKTLSGKFIILQISSDNAFNTSRYGYATLSDGTKPDWSSYTAKYAYFKQYKKVATYMKNDTDSNDWIDYFQIA